MIDAKSALNDQRVFVTGGAGFIGSRLIKALTARGALAVAYDNMHPQVHGHAGHADPEITLVRGDVCDRASLAQALAAFGPTQVVHLAAETGTGQSADEVARYCEVNVLGTATLIEALRELDTPPARVVLSASRAVYGEGAYADAGGHIQVPEPRTAAAMASGRFDVFGPDGTRLEPVPTPETVQPRPGSVYGSTKLMQEYLLQQATVPWDHVILRLQNVYGPGQSLRNPYTGVLSIFCQQVMEGRQLNIFEDGEIHRDFVYVDDVVDALIRACISPRAAGRVINIGTGELTAIGAAAGLIQGHLGVSTPLRISGDFRAGDIRHAVAEIALARELLDWQPQVSFADGVDRLVAWARQNSL